jgi:hypothetical protein
MESFRFVARIAAAGIRGGGVPNSNARSDGKGAQSATRTTTGARRTGATLVSDCSQQIY